MKHTLSNVTEKKQISLRFPIEKLVVENIVSKMKPNDNSSKIMEYVIAEAEPDWPIEAYIDYA